jgi:hypothetical protein
VFENEPRTDNTLTTSPHKATVKIHDGSTAVIIVIVVVIIIITTATVITTSTITIATVFNFTP